MKIAIIAPTNYLENYSTKGDIHLVLAQVALRDEAYRKFYEKEKKYKILDNGLFEEGKGLSPKELLEAAHAVNADEVILTDVLFKKNLTLEALKECYGYFQAHTMNHEFAFMGVPQAFSAIEWIMCYQQIAELPFVRTIGLSKLSIPKSWGYSIADSRIACLDQLFSLQAFNKSKNHHLLGSSNAAHRELLYYIEKGYHKFINSMDTSAPFVYGFVGKKLIDEPEEILDKLDFSLNSMPIQHSSAIEKNIKNLLKEAQRDS